MISQTKAMKYENTRQHHGIIFEEKLAVAMSQVIAVRGWRSHVRLSISNAHTSNLTLCGFTGPHETVI